MRSKRRRASPRAAARQVTLSYRGDAFARAKTANRERVALAARSGRLQILLESQVQRIGPTSVVLAVQGRELELANDAVIVSVGGILPAEFLQKVGVQVETKYGTA